MLFILVLLFCFYRFQLTVAEPSLLNQKLKKLRASKNSLFKVSSGDLSSLFNLSNSGDLSSLMKAQDYNSISNSAAGGASVSSPNRERSMITLSDSISNSVVSDASISSTKSTTTCLKPCRDAEKRARIERDYNIDAPENEKCYWRFRSGDELLTGCLCNKWLLFVGDSELRGIVLSLLKEVLDNKYKDPTRDKINLETRHSAYFNVDGYFDETKFNLGVIDFLIESDALTGEIIQVQRWSATKYSEEANNVMIRLKHSNSKLLDYTRTGVAFEEILKNRNSTNIPEFELSTKSHFTRISYIFTKWIDEVLGTYLSLLKPKSLNQVDQLIMNGGKWDLYHFWHDSSDKLPMHWYKKYSLTNWDAVIAYKLYLKRFETFVKYCNNAPQTTNRKKLACTWVTMSWAQETVSSISEGDPTVASVSSTIMKALNVALKQDAHSSVTVLDRWMSSRQLGNSDMVDSAHYDNLSNREDLARLMGIICESFETGEDSTVVLPKRLMESRGKGGKFCRIVVDKCMTEGYSFSKRYCSNNILGVTGRQTWKFTCRWKIKKYTCDFPSYSVSV